MTKPSLHLPGPFKFFSLLCGLVTAGSGTVAIAGWLTGSRILSGFREDYIPMAPNTALSFIVLGSALCALMTGGNRALELSRVAASVVFVFSLIRFIEFNVPIDLNVDQWIFRVSSEKLGLIPVGRMALPTALNFLFASVALFLASSSERRWFAVVLTRGLTGLTTFIGLIFCLGYLYGAPLLYSGTTIPMALNTAISFFVLGLGLIVHNAGYDAKERRRAAEALRRAHDELEVRVLERTAELAVVNEVLQVEIAEHKRAEEDLEKYKDHLEELVKDRTTRLETANKELEAFSYSVSHDLRAPLRSIDGFSQALIEDYGEKFDGEGRKCLDRVRAGAQRMGELIDDLLDLSRVARAELNLEGVDLSALAREISEGLQRQDPERIGRFSIAPGLKARADPRLLRIALENLLANAWKFTGRRTDSHIEFGAAEGDGDKAYYVRDNGVGFDMAYGGKLFDPFQRLHGAAEFPGTGIGLATVQRVIHKHGGRIWADGKVDQGAVFYFTLS